MSYDEDRSLLPSRFVEKVLAPEITVGGSTEMGEFIKAVHRADFGIDEEPDRAQDLRTSVSFSFAYGSARSFVMLASTSSLLTTPTYVAAMCPDLSIR